MARRKEAQPTKQKSRLPRALRQDAAIELGAQLLSVLPHSHLEYLSEIPARDRWRSVTKGNQQKPRAVWDRSSRHVLAFMFNEDQAEPASAVVLAPLQEPHENDIRFIQIFCRIFNEDLRTAPDMLTQSELWEVLKETHFSRALGRFSAFSTLPFMHWLRTIESPLHLRYEGTEFSATIFMTKQRQWIVDNVKAFVPFSPPLSFEAVLLREKWVRSLAREIGVGLVGLGHSGSIIGLVAIPRRDSKSFFPPHRALSGAVSLVRPGTMAFISAPNADLYVVLPNGAIFLRTQGKWLYLNYSSFRQLLGQHMSKTIVDSVFRTILDLSFQRKGALLCFLENSKAISRIVPDYGQSNRANEALRKSVRNLDVKRVAHQRIPCRSLERASLKLRSGGVRYKECFGRCRLRSYSSRRRSYSRYVEAFTSSRRRIFSMIRLPNPCRISFRIPIFLTSQLRERLGWISGSRARLALCVYSMGV
jgi:hypothetical protein